MTRILFTSTPGAGHFTPVVPFIRGCSEHAEVLLAGPEELRPQAERLGVAFAPVDEPTQQQFGAAVGRAAAAGIPGGDDVIVRDLFVGLRARLALPALLDACERFAPDLVVHEEAEYAGPLASHALGIPSARVAICLATAGSALLDHAAEPLAQLAADHGLAVPDLHATPALTLFPESLEEPASLPAPARFRDPGWATPGAARDLVYVSFGSVAGLMPHLRHVFAEAAAAVADAGDVVMTVGQRFDPASLGELPANVRVEPWIDQAEILSRARAVVCHAGGGTTLGALAAGCPVVAVPLFSTDQFVNARRVEQVGAGIAALSEASAIRAAVEAVLTDPSYATAAGRLADELASHASADDVLAQLAGLRVSPWSSSSSETTSWG